MARDPHWDMRRDLYFLWIKPGYAERLWADIYQLSWAIEQDRFKTLRTWEKPKTMTEEKKTKAQFESGIGPFAIDPVGIKITTPAGHTIDADAAAKAYDGLYMIARSFPVQGLLTNDDVYHVIKALEQRQSLVDTHRGERDTARAERDEARADSRAICLERDRAYAEIAKLRAELRAEHAPLFPVLAMPGSLDGVALEIGRAARQHIPAGVELEVRTRRSPGVPAGTVRVTLEEGEEAFPRSARPPAVTPDTPVTLGMLRDLDTRGAELCYRRHNTSNLAVALREKIGR